MFSAEMVARAHSYAKTNNRLTNHKPPQNISKTKAKEADEHLKNLTPKQYKK
jgi:hypothetical protein